MRVPRIRERFSHRHLRRFGSVSLIALIWEVATAVILVGAAGSSAIAQVDTTPPELLSLTLETPIVDISGGDADVIFTGRATDDLSGVSGVYINIQTPNGGGYSVYAHSFAADGSFTATRTIEQYSPTGTYTIHNVRVDDNQSNSLILFADDLPALGFPTSWEVAVADIEVAPVVASFGDVDVGLSASQVVTISSVGDADLSVTAISFDGGAAGDFSISSAPALPATLLPDETADVEVSFSPSVLGAASAILQITSNDPDQGLVEVMLSGTGVTLDPSDTLGTILIFFDDSVAAGTLVGSGPGGSGPGRLAALRNMLEAAGDLIDAGQAEMACNQLLDAYLRTDGVSPPPDFVAGSAVSELAMQIQDLRTSMGCDVVCGDVNRSGTLDSEDTNRARDYLLRVTPEPPFELPRCSVSGEERACTVADVARMRREEDALSVTLQNNCLSAILDPGSP